VFSRVRCGLARRTLYNDIPRAQALMLPLFRFRKWDCRPFKVFLFTALLEVSFNLY
jgi:hypothetical protein